MAAFWEQVKAFFSAIPSNLTDWLIYGAIAVVTVIGVVRCLIPLWQTTASLRRAIHRLQDHAGEQTTRPVWQEPRFLGKRLKGCWLRFLQNALQLDRRGLPCAVEDYINDDTVTHGPGNAQLAELIPNLLTSLGILGTFLGMTRGLAGLNTTDTQAMMGGIQTLINGMRFAFGTSVAGVSCSLVFNMLNRISQGSSYRAVDDFVESFTQLAMERPLDNDVQLICQNEDRNHLLGEVTENVSGRMATSIELAIGRAMAPMATSMDNFLRSATQTQVAGMQHMVDSFIRSLNASMGGQFLELGRTLSEVNQQQQVSAERLNQTIAAAQSITTDVIRLNAVSTDIIQHFEHYVSELTAARNRDEGFEASAASLLTSMEAAARDQSTLITSLQEAQAQLGKAVADFQRQGSGALTALQEAGEGSKASLEAACSTLSARCADFAGEVGKISASLTGFEQGMQRLTGLMEQQAKQQAGDGETARVLSRLQQTLHAMQASLGGAGGETGEEA